MPTEIIGPVEFTYSCGHRGIISCLATTQEHVTFIARRTCDHCRTVDAGKLYGLDLKRAPEDSPEIIFEDEADVTLRSACADCDRTFFDEELALATDGRRCCTECIGKANDLAEFRRQLEEEGQQRLF